MPACTQLTPHPANPLTTTTDARHIFGCGNPRGAVSVRREFVEPRPPLPLVDLLPPIPILPATPDIAFLRLVLQIARDVLGEPFSRVALGYPMSSTPSTISTTGTAATFPPHLDIWRAAREGDLPLLSYLVETKGHNINGINEVNASPLYYAALCGHVSCVEYLLQMGLSRTKMISWGNDASMQRSMTLCDAF
jgi:hypothetical protein